MTVGPPSWLGDADARPADRLVLVGERLFL
jgi:hypothetical protein